MAEEKKTQEVKESPNLKFYKMLQTPPQGALKLIQGGNLKGKSEINPQWKIEAMTAAFGPCGIGWKFEVTNEKTVECPGGQILLFMTIELRYRCDDQWSEPILGYGGDFIVDRNKNGLVPNDEAYKMCLTDALGNAMRNIGVAGDVYRGLFDGKYNNRQQTQGGAQQQQNRQQVQRQGQGQAQNSAPKANQQSTGDKYVRISPEGNVYVAINAGKNERGQQLVSYKNVLDLKPETLTSLFNNEHYKLAHAAIEGLLASVAEAEMKAQAEAKPADNGQVFKTPEGSAA